MTSQRSSDSDRHWPAERCRDGAHLRTEGWLSVLKVKPSFQCKEVRSSLWSRPGEENIGSGTWHGTFHVNGKHEGEPCCNVHMA